MKKLAAGIATVLLAGTTIPVVPQEMHFVMAYEAPVTSQVSLVTATGTDPTPLNAPQFADTDGDGLVEVAVFSDASGKLSYVPIPSSRYKSMGARNGEVNNPQKQEYLTLYQALQAQPASAAIAFSATSSAFTNGATSVTWSHTISGTNTILYVCAMASSARTITAPTFNAVSTTLINRSAGGQPVAGYYLIAPAAGAHNIVASIDSSSFLYTVAASYTGVKQSAQPDANTSASVTAAAISTTVTTVADNSWGVSCARATTDGVTSASTNETARTGPPDAGLVQLYDTNGPKTPAGSLTMQSTAVSQNLTQTMASFSPAAVVLDDLINLILFD